MIVFKDLLRSTRKTTTKLTASDVSRTMGVSRSAVSQWELGQLLPSPGHLERYLDVLGIDESDTAREPFRAALRRAHIDRDRQRS